MFLDFVDSVNLKTAFLKRLAYICWIDRSTITNKYLMTDVLPKIFKGIALFTPGGDLVYGIDPDRQAQWHIHLCHQLQEIWQLSDTPHFLVPGYTATVERLLDPQTRQLTTIAEVYPGVKRYIPLLQVLFELEATTDWHIAPWQEEYCNRAIIETHRQHFPQLWSRKDLIVRIDPKHSLKSAKSDRETIKKAIATSNSPAEEYILHLYISSNDSSAESTLSSIHQILEEGLTSPYTLKIIDIAKNPEQAVAHQILITPTLIRISPKPTKRIIGQLHDIERILNIISS